MNEITHMIIALLAGFFIGILFFGTLWFSLKKSLHSKSPALWIFGSFIIRVSITLTGFYFVAGGNWISLLICLAGFISARYLISIFIPGLKPVKVGLNKKGEL